MSSQTQTLDPESAKQSLRRANSFSRQKKNRASAGAEAKADQDYSEDALSNPRAVADLATPEDALNEVVAKEAVELFDKGQYDEAGEKWWSLAEHARAAGNKSQECTALHNVGTALVMLQELTEAVTCYNKALQVALDIEDRGAQVELYECLAWVYRELNHAPHAVECLNSLLLLHEEANHLPGQVLATCGLGSIHDQTGQYAEAASYYEHALELAKAAKDDKAVARVLGDLGTSYVQIGDFDKGVECYEKALDMALSDGDKDRQMRTYGNLAIAANLREQDEEAVAFFQKSIALAQELGERAMENRGRADLAIVLRALGRADEAVESLAQAVRLARDDSDVVALGEHQMQLGATFLKYKKDPAAADAHLAGAIDSWRECAGLLRAQLCETRVSAQQRNSDNIETAEFFDARPDAWVLRQLALVDMGKAKEALAVAEESRAIATRELLALGGKDHRAVGQLLAGGEEMKTALDARLDSAAIAAIAAAARTPLLVLSLAGDNEALAWVVPADPAADLVFKRLDLTTAFSAVDCPSVVHAVSRLHEAVGVTLSAVACRGSPPGPAEDDERSAAEGNAEAAAKAGSPSAEDLARAATTTRTMLGALHAALVAPLADALEGIKEICVVPSGVLSLVPFPALAPSSTPERPLISSMAVFVAPSVAAFDCLRKRERATEPALGPDGLVPPTAVVVGSAETLPGLGLQPLGHAKEEADSVASILESAPSLGLETKLLTGAEARSRTVLEELVRRPPALLHLAVHAQPKCVALAPVPAPTPASAATASDEAAQQRHERAEAEAEADAEEDDGLVHKDQVHLTWLPSHPVVALVGSHTGGGDLCEDGVLGLPRAFVAAGARCVLSSMWAVPDESAKRIMVAWYRKSLDENAPSLAVALQRAICSAAQHEDGSWDDPAHWAAFTLMGNAPSF